MNIQVGACKTLLGTMFVATVNDRLCASAFGPDMHSFQSSLRKRFPGERLIDGECSIKTTAAAVAEAVAGATKPSSIDIHVDGTPFQRLVWDVLGAIPPGSTMSYAEVASRIGRPSAARAVAQACRVNRIAVLIPCHRVIGSDGGLSGYAWGVWRKKALLDRERAASSTATYEHDPGDATPAAQSIASS